jgi:hypothetical protein
LTLVKLAIANIFEFIDEDYLIIQWEGRSAFLVSRTVLFCTLSTTHNNWIKIKGTKELYPGVSKPTSFLLPKRGMMINLLLWF